MICREGVAHSGKLVESISKRQFFQVGELMKALILYVGLVVLGAVLSALLGVYLEKAISSTVSLVAFLVCFFANFGISWIIVIYIMDGTLRKSQA
jgi:uncharacterized membrane protein (DUF485 family)